MRVEIRGKYSSRALTAAASCDLAVVEPVGEAFSCVCRVDGLHCLGARRANQPRFEAGVRMQLERWRNGWTVDLERRHAVPLETLGCRLAVVTCLHVA